MLCIQNPGQSQTKVRAKSVDDNGATSVRILQKLNSDQLVNGVENNLQDTDDQQLQAAHFSQDSTVGNEDCSGSKFRGDQTADKEKDVRMITPLKVNGGWGTRRGRGGTLSDKIVSVKGGFSFQLFISLLRALPHPFKDQYTVFSANF